MKPFLKWAGGKRWLVSDPEFSIPDFSGRYIEPFLGGGAVFFHAQPTTAILSDINERLIELYQAIKTDWRPILGELRKLQRLHSPEFYYEERSRRRRCAHTRAAQFLYLNRTCFNGLYRENLKGEFNVPVGTKTKVIFGDEDFEAISERLSCAEIVHADFEETISRATTGDLIFADPPYTTAHNMNGFVKYNQRIFSWDDQIRLRAALGKAAERGVKIVLTNASHESITELYAGFGSCKSVGRPSVIAGFANCRRPTSEALYVFG